MRMGAQSRGCGPRFGGAGFTLIELMAAIGVMTLIVLVLYTMFDQTQKAMRSNVSQVDILESGRSAMDNIVRDLEQMQASDQWGCTNFYAGLTATPMLQSLPGREEYRTNILQDTFFLTCHGKSWNQVGYVVRTNAGQPVGTLHRIVLSTNLGRPFWDRLNDLYLRKRAEFMLSGSNALAPAFQTVAGGVVHFRVTAYDDLGRLMEFWRPDWWKVYGMNVWMTNAPASDIPLETLFYSFRSNALPATVEIELGILDPVAVDRAKAMPPPQAERYLAREGARVHLFQQKIPIRTAR